MLMNNTFSGDLPCENKRACFLPITTELGLSGLKGPQINLKYSHVYATVFKE